MHVILKFIVLIKRRVNCVCVHIAMMARDINASWNCYFFIAPEENLHLTFIAMFVLFLVRISLGKHLPVFMFFCYSFFSITHQQIVQKKPNKQINGLMKWWWWSSDLIWSSSDWNLERKLKNNVYKLNFHYQSSSVIWMMSARNMCFSHKNGWMVKKWCNQMSKKPLNSFQICILKCVFVHHRWTRKQFLKWNAYL